jgi:signal transduction histidine kinase
MTARLTMPKARETAAALRDILRVAVESPDTGQALAQIAQCASEIAAADGAYVEQVDFERNEIIATAPFGDQLPPAGTRGPYSGSVAEAAITENQPVLVGDVAAESRSILAILNQPVAALVLPLACHRGVVGVLILLRKDVMFSVDEISELRVFADITAMVLQRSTMWGEAEEGRRRAVEALRSRDHVLRVVSHDLRNPINTINLGVAVLEGSPMNEEKRAQTIPVLRRSLDRVNRLLEDLTSIARLEAGQGLPVQLRPENARDLAEEACRAINLAAQGKTLKISCIIKSAATVNVDRDRLLQALYNVIDNAVKFTPPGGCVTFTTQDVDEEVRFTIRDNGPGICEADQKRIFDPYWQEPSTAHLGSGLGLSITKQIVEQHGGRIWVESVIDAGTSFIIAVPVYR